MNKAAYLRGYQKIASLIGGPPGPNIGNLRQMYQNGQINGNQFGNFAGQFGTGMQPPSKVSGDLIFDAWGSLKPRRSAYTQGGLNRRNRGFGGLSGYGYDPADRWGFQGGFNQGGRGFGGLSGYGYDPADRWGFQGGFNQGSRGMGLSRSEQRRRAVMM